MAAAVGFSEQSHIFSNFHNFICGGKKEGTNSLVYQLQWAMDLKTQQPLKSDFHNRQESPHNGWLPAKESRVFKPIRLS